ncbi:MAG: response regulator [Dehalococcoidia bacterium]|nr:response regulator [Dehalococcoidia bacterium]
MDDDRAMRVLLRRLLEADGHRVETAVDASDALEMFAPLRFSLVISDVVMPGMTGIELRAELALQDPGLPCLLVSGDDVERGLHYAASTYRTVFLAKPFEPEELLRLVHSTPLPKHGLEGRAAS